MALTESVQDRSASVDADARRRDTRRKRYALRCSLWKLSSLPSVKGCARNVASPTAGGAGLASILRGADGVAGFAGLTLCSSIWACPCCSARIRHQRAVDIETAGLAQLRNGGALMFLTLTMPHDAGDALADTLDVVMGGWRKLLQRKWMRAWREAHGAGFIRAVEVTHTAQGDGGSGWHPHVHVLVFLDAPLTVAGRADWLGKVEAAWTRHVVGAGFRAPRGDGIGVRLQDVDGEHNAAGLLAYLSKVQDDGGSWNVGTELAKGHHKTGRRASSRTPFDLAELAAAGDPVALLLWHEYEAATKGRKALHWTDGLRALLDVPPLVEDGDVPEVGEPALTVATFTFDEWRVVVRYGRRLDELLSLAERERYAELDELLDDWLGRGTAVHPGVQHTVAA